MQQMFCSPYNMRLNGLRQTTLRSPSQEKFCVGRRADLDGIIWALKDVFGGFAITVTFAVTSAVGFTACINEMLHCVPLPQVV
jgi:hypothetical protein